MIRRIRQVEEWLVRVPLFNRNTDQITLTPEGQTFISTSSENLFALTHMRNDLHQCYQKRTSVLRFAMLNTLSLTFFLSGLIRVNRSNHTHFIRLCDQKPTFVEHISLLYSGKTDFFANLGSRLGLAYIQQLAPYPMLALGQECTIAVCLPDNEGKPRYPIGQSADQIPLAELRSKFLLCPCDHSPATLPLEPIYENGMSINLKAMVLAGSSVAWLPDSLLEGGTARWTTDARRPELLGYDA